MTKPNTIENFRLWTTSIIEHCAFWEGEEKKRIFEELGYNSVGNEDSCDFPFFSSLFQTEAYGVGLKSLQKDYEWSILHWKKVSYKLSTKWSEKKKRGERSE